MYLGVWVRVDGGRDPLVVGLPPRRVGRVAKGVGEGRSGKDRDPESDNIFLLRFCFFKRNYERHGSLSQMMIE